MRKRTILAGASAIALAVAAAYHLRRSGEDEPPPVVARTGERDDDGMVVKRHTVDWEAVVTSALVAKASLIVLTVKGDVIRDQELEESIRYLPLPASRARVRVKYHVEYPIGFALEPGDFAVRREGSRMVVTVARPGLVARPSIRLLSYNVLESGILIDEKAAVIELQQRLQPEAERRGRDLAARTAVRIRSAAVLRGFLEAVLAKTAAPDAGPPPEIAIDYR